MTSTINSEDHLFRFLANRCGEEEGRKRYIEGGASDAKQISDTVSRLFPRRNIRILEFACGYGRITRYLKDLMPEADLTACDIHPEACKFVSEEIGVQTMLSQWDIDAGVPLSSGLGFDFIFVISLFSHLPDKHYGKYLHFLLSNLSQDGIMQFTTHGERSMQNYPAGFLEEKTIKGDGWYYNKASDQADLSVDDYGTMLAFPCYVASCLHRCDAKLLEFSAARWWGIQDEWIVARRGSA